MPRLPSFSAAFVAALIGLPAPAQVPGQGAVADAVAPVAKTDVTTDVTDLGWPDAEPGWGIQRVPNRAVVFATLDIYGPTGSPTYYVAAFENPPGGSTGAWTGTLDATTGPGFGSAFDPAAVIETAVGIMTLVLTGIGTWTLEYTVGATSVSKTVNRHPLRFEDNEDTCAFVHTWMPTGVGRTAADAYSTGTVPPTGVMQRFPFDVDTSGVTPQWKLTPVEHCSAALPYSQRGRLGQYAGTLSCPASGHGGSLTFVEVANGEKRLDGRSTMDWTHGCRWSGRYAGVSFTPWPAPRAGSAASSRPAGRGARARGRSRRAGGRRRPRTSSATPRRSPRPRSRRARRAAR
jgi:hypothetical protein